MSGDELNDIIGALRKYGMRVPKTVTTAKELAVSILSQCADIDEGEEGEEQETPVTPAPDPNAPPVEMSATGSRRTPTSPAQEVIDRQAALARRMSGK